LNENNIISHELTEKLGKMVGLRNRLVHLYWEIDEELVFEHIQSNLADFDQFTFQIIQYGKIIVDIIKQEVYDGTIANY